MGLNQKTRQLILKFQHIYSSTFRILHHKPKLSDQGLLVMLFMQDLSNLRRYSAHYCKEIFFRNFEIWAKFEPPSLD